MSQPAPQPEAQHSVRPKALSPWYRSVVTLMRGLYYRQVSVVWQQDQTIWDSYANIPKLIIASHRNGATDGIVYQQVFATAPSLVSAQLLRGAMKLLFTGIAVVRDKDVARYAMQKSAYLNPIDAAVRQLQSGGDVIIMPEGSSCWHPSPLAYQHGMARVVEKMLQAGDAFVVVPMGIFYQAPERFRSRVSVQVGSPFCPSLTAQNSVMQQLSIALDAVSVNCQDRQHFNRVQAAAYQAYRQGEDYGTAFLRLQQQPMLTSRTAAESTDPTDPLKMQQVLGVASIPEGILNRNADTSITSRGLSWLWLVGYVALCVCFAPVWLASKLAAKLSDARNNLAFFRIVLASVALPVTVLLWLGVLAVLWYLNWTVTLRVLLSMWGLALLGFMFYPEVLPSDMTEVDLAND